jgi:DNA mismatch repair ATPase MutL
MKDFSMHILDILQNSIVAKATKIEFTILKEKQKDLLTFIFKDNGCGMDAETVE